DRLLDVRHRPRHPRDRHARLSRARRPAPDARLGDDDRRRADLPHDALGALDGARDRGRDHGARTVAARRWPRRPLEAGMTEPLVRLGLARRRARARSLELMRLVGIPDPVRRAESYPHELSGGLRQRVMIAIALSANPKLILCDEPTTALDVTIQDQILKLLRSLQNDLGLSLVFVSHDLAVIAQTCRRVAVMYAGQVVETGRVDELFHVPRHPYTLSM